MGHGGEAHFAAFSQSGMGELKAHYEQSGEVD